MNEDFVFPTSLTSNGDFSVVTAFNAGSNSPLHTADSRHPAFAQIVAGLRAGDPNVWALFDVASGVMSRFNSVTERVSYNGVDVLWDGDPIHSVLAEQLQRAIADGDPTNYTALAKFWEKLESNPNSHSRDQAFDFLSAHKFQITAEGDVVGYKGFSKGYDGVLRSTASSRVVGKPSAFVNGEPQPELSVVSQKIGDVVSMPRSEVTHDPNRSCERGLHVATRAYASSYGTLGEVHFNPRDIVSVPTADNGAKVRVCRYTLEREVDKYASDDHDSPVLRANAGPIWAGDVSYKV